MFPLLPFITLFIALFTTVIAQDCVDPGYVLCLPAGSNLGGVPDSSFGDSAFWDSLLTGASWPVSVGLDRRELAHRLTARQDALCCAPDPDVECLVTTDENIPFCYNQQTTLYAFSDKSFGFLSNGTYYAADGTFVDFDKGYYSSTDGSTGTFAPATASDAVPSSVATATATVTRSGGSGGGATQHANTAPANTAPANTAPTNTSPAKTAAGGQQPPAAKETVQTSTNGASREMAMGMGRGMSGAVGLVAVFVGCVLFL